MTTEDYFCIIIFVCNASLWLHAVALLTPFGIYEKVIVVVLCLSFCTPASVMMVPWSVTWESVKVSKQKSNTWEEWTLPWIISSPCYSRFDYIPLPSSTNTVVSTLLSLSSPFLWDFLLFHSWSASGFHLPHSSHFSHSQRVVGVDSLFSLHTFFLPGTQPFNSRG